MKQKLSRKKRLARQPAAVPEVLLVPKIIGYARVSTEEQDAAMQVTQLREAGCDIIFEEKISARSSKKPEYNLMRKLLERGDTLVVYSTSRLARDLQMLIKIVKELEAEGVALRSLTEPQLNTKTATGKLMFNIQGAFDQFERDKIAERTVDGMAERRRQGVTFGRPTLVSPEVAKKMKVLRHELGVPVPKIATRFGVSNSAVYNHT